ATFGFLAERAAVAVGVGRVHHSGDQWTEAGALHGLARSKGKRAHGSPVKAAEESDDFFAARGVARELDGALHGLGARVAERDAARNAAWGDFGKLFGQGDQLFIVEVRAGHVDQTGRLFLNRLDHLRVAVSGGHYGDAG